MTKITTSTWRWLSMQCFLQILLVLLSSSLFHNNSHGHDAIASQSSSSSWAVYASSNVASTNRPVLLSSSSSPFSTTTIVQSLFETNSRINKLILDPFFKVLLATSTSSSYSAFVRNSSPLFFSHAHSVSSTTNQQKPNGKATSLSFFNKNKSENKRITSPKKLQQQQQQQQQALGGPLYVIKTGLCGGIAGAVGTALLYPFDAAKTLRQSSPKEYPSVLSALKYMLLYDPNCQQQQHHHHIAAGKILHFYPQKLLSLISSLHVGRVYKGILTSSLGAIPSSALYFGAYETSKTNLRRLHLFTSSYDDNDETFRQRLFIHGTAAACGNIMSSAIFVPKELIKQKMQYLATSSSVTGRSLLQSTVQTILKEKGIKGLYGGYRTVLMRNIPTAALRFCLYEEFRRIVLYNNNNNNNRQTDGDNNHDHGSSWKLFVAGAMAGAAASGIMTPIDVLKTRVSTGFCPIEPGSLFGCVQLIIQDSGWKSLYAGAGSRIFFSAAFSGIGFGTFELAKNFMGISNNNNNQKKNPIVNNSQQQQLGTHHNAKIQKRVPKISSDT